MTDSRLTHREQLWEYLVAAKAFDASLVDELKETVRKSPWKPLGAILVDLGHMRFKQIAHLLRIQADEMHMRIGELAIREGYCSPKQIDDALAAQFAQNKTPIEVLAADERVDGERLMQGLSRYVIQLEDDSSRAAAKAA